MKNSITILAILALIAICFAVPTSMSIHGKLTNASGVMLAGTYNMSFYIYNVTTNGTALYSLENTNITTDSKGVYSVQLDNLNLTFLEPYYLGVVVANDTEMSPRINITTSPYSFRANSSDYLEADRNYTINELTASNICYANGTNCTALNPFDQSLNTSDNVIFNSFNTTTHSTVNGFLKVGNQEWYGNDVFGITDGFGGGLLIDGYDDGYGRGGSMLSSRRNPTLQPFFIFSGYDLDNPWEASGAQRQIWFGSFGTNQPDATDMIFTTSENYAWENPQSSGQYSMTMARMHMGKMWIGTSYYLPTYTADGSIPRYKLDVGDGDLRMRDSSNLGFGGNEGSDYLANIYYDGANLTMNGTPVQIISDLTAPNICYANGTNCAVGSYTNIAMTNQSNTFTANQNITQNLTIGNGTIYWNGTALIIQVS